ncbi:MAG: hypothetical protein IPO58_24860 [Betaproteobacteria bacterium]|nr:hypothetical protein [Betaproteobacteria bacterium]
MPANKAILSRHGRHRRNVVRPPLTALASELKTGCSGAVEALAFQLDATAATA